MPDEQRETPRTTGDADGEHLWLTYAQIGERLGISADAARQLVRRRKWRRVVPNRLGAAPTLVVVRADELPAEPPTTAVGDTGQEPAELPSHAEPPRQALPMNPDIGAALSALSTAVEVLHGQLDEANANLRAEREGRAWTDQALATERARADDAVRDLAAAEQRATATAAEAAQARDAAAVAKRLIGEAERALTTERAARETAEGEAALLRSEAAADRERADEAECLAGEARAAIDLERAAREQAEEEATRLRSAEQERQAAHRATQVSIEATEAQLRQMIEADEARRSLGRWARLRAAWRGV